MEGFIEKSLSQRRSLEKALADLLANYQNDPTPRLARTIELLEAEIELRNGPDKGGTLKEDCAEGGGTWVARGLVAVAVLP